MRPLPAALAAAFPKATLLAAVLTLAACGRPEPAERPAAEPAVQGQTVRFPTRPDGLKSEPAQPAGSLAITLPGRLVWDEDHTARVVSPFAGRVVRALVQVGDTVRAGQPLAELASADFDQAQADLNSAEAAATLARQNLERQRELQAAGIVAQKDLQQAEAEARRTAAERQRAATRLAQAGGARGTDFLLRAPIAGVVVDKAINPGQEFRPDQADKPLFVVTDPTRLWLWLDADESLLGRLAKLPQKTLSLVSDAYPGRSFSGTVVQQSDAIDPTTRTLKLRATVDNRERLLKAEMFVTAHLAEPVAQDGAAATQVNIPVAAVFSQDGRRWVFVQQDDKRYTRVPVTVTMEQAGRALVTGLDENQPVVVDGALYLQKLLSNAARSAAAAQGK